MAQVYLVTGGYLTAPLASTELLVEGAYTWAEAGPLPLARYGLRAASVNNHVIVTGEVSTGVYYNKFNNYS